LNIKSLLGKITKVDIKTLYVLFYENFNVVILLDNQLNETQKNILENTSALAVSATGIASKSAVGLQ
jgi:hypothetical protein